MTTHDMDPPSDNDIDLSSDVGSEGPIDDAEASRILQSAKLYGFGGSGFQHPTGRRMEFSPTPPPGASPSVAQAPASHPESATRPSADDLASENGFVKEDSVDSATHAAAGNRASPAAAASTPSAANRSRTSIWTHFTRDADYATNRRGRCVYCHNYYSCSSGSTGNMWRHIKRSHPEMAAHAAPLATHGHTVSTPQPRMDAPYSSIDNRARKRQASMSSPVAEHSAGTAASVLAPMQHPPPPPPPPLSARAVGGSHYPLHATTQLQQLVADDTHALGSADMANAGAESLAQALKLLLALAGRSSSNNNNNNSGSSTTAATGTLINNTGANSSGISTTAHHAPQLLGLLDALGTGRTADAEHFSARGARPSPLRTTSEGGANGCNASGVDACHHCAAVGVGHFASAVGEAIRANTAAQYADTGSRAQKALAAYADFAVRDLLPPERALSSGVRRLLAELQPSDTSTAPTIEALTEELRKRRKAAASVVRKHLDSSSPRKVSISMGTGALVDGLYYVAVYAHWIDDQYSRHSLLLNCRCITRPAGGSDLLSVFESTMTRYGLFDRLGVVTAAYTRDTLEFLNQVEGLCHARGAVFDLERSQASCIFSALEQARDRLVSALFADEACGVAQLRNAVARALKNQDRHTLADMCRAQGISLSALEFDDARPWQSTLQFLDTVLSHRQVFDSALSKAADGMEQHTPVLSSNDWLAVAQSHMLVRLLQVALETLDLNSTNPFPDAVKVVPVYDVLADQVSELLKNGQLVPGVHKVAELLAEHLVQCHPFQISTVYRLAPIFDPRLKTAYYTDRGYDAAWQARVLRDAQAMLAEHVSAVQQQQQIASVAVSGDANIGNIGVLGLTSKLTSS
ncbi:hypothetical protein GGI07_002406 [Coemansia sp. Benny D115]|nr:hypothetical protein GGI07_002406 [Coemansia sp. Benny D115]